MNRILPRKRAEILAAFAGGATIREIARDVGAAKQTVASVVRRVVDDRKKLLYALSDAAQKAYGVDIVELDEWCALAGQIGWHCPIHPEAEPPKTMGYDPCQCFLCGEVTTKRARGLKRHHQRRRAEGRPIAPPRRTVADSDDQAPEGSPPGLPPILA